MHIHTQHRYIDPRANLYSCNSNTRALIHTHIQLIHDHICTALSTWNTHTHTHTDTHTHRGSCQCSQTRVEVNVMLSLCKSPDTEHVCVIMFVCLCQWDAGMGGVVLISRTRSGAFTHTHTHTHTHTLRVSSIPLWATSPSHAPIALLKIADLILNIDAASPPQPPLSCL